MNLKDWAKAHLDGPNPVEQRVNAILNDPQYRERIDGIVDSLDVTRYRAGWLILHAQTIRS